MKIVIISLILLISLIIFGGIIADIRDQEESMVSKLYGIGTLLLFFVWIPLFLIWRSGKTKFKAGLTPSKEKHTID
jgi:hypothetical protein